jgi:hypothetical protein
MAGLGWRNCHSLDETILRQRQGSGEKYDKKTLVAAKWHE